MSEIVERKNIKNPSSEIGKRRSSLSIALFFLFGILIVLGLINLYSACSGNDLFYSQLKHTAIGLTAFAVFGWLIPVRFLNHYAYWIFAFTCLSLFVVLFVGKIGGGAQSWIVIGPIRIQPSEFAKITTFIVVARFFFNSRRSTSYRIRDLWPVLSTVGLIFLLIFPQPDFGTAGFIALIALSQLAFIKINARSILSVFATLFATAPIVWTFLLKDYQRFRVLSFLNPEADPHGKGYNAHQSIVAIGSGGLTGKGYLSGTQSQLQFLPERHTDFVFSVFAEEHGFWSSTIIFILFAAISYIALEIARQARDTFSSLVAVGISSVLFLHFVINTAMVLRVFPVVGLPLQFFSYGGSTFLMVCICVGILAAIDKENHGRKTT